MNYSEATQWLFEQTAMFCRDGNAAYKPGLQTITELCRLFGDPHTRLRTVHVAGTNGKGSTASLIAAALQSAGFRVGLYTSPHIVDFRERIRINGEMIPQQAVSDFVNRWIELKSPLRPSFFELTTAMAFEHFVREQVDYAVIEVGLGGRLDSTNIIRPIVSVVTSISPDHTAILGNTLEEIAAEKAGIFKPDIPAVIGPNIPDAARLVLLKQAKAIGAPAVTPSELKAEEQPDGSWYFPEEDITCPLRGGFQPLNVATALAALSFIAQVSADDIRQGFLHVEQLTGLRGRLTVLQREPQLIVCDTGHNPGAWAFLARELRKMPQPLCAIVGFAADKDVDAILDLLPRDAEYIFTAPDTHRALPADELLGRARQKDLPGQTAPDLLSALELARQKAVGSIFIGGSNYLLAPLCS